LKIKNLKITKHTIFIFLFCAFVTFTKAQSPFRIFTLDANLKSEVEQNNASLVLKSLVLNKMEFLYNNESRFKTNHKADLKRLYFIADSLTKMIPKGSENSWEEDYGLKLEGVPKQERWKELTYYYTEFDVTKGPAEVMKGKKKYVLQIRVLIDMSGMIEDIQILKGKKMVNRDAQIARSYNILYKPRKKSN
jgi:hypothetical protein